MSSSLSPGSLSLPIPSSFTTSADLHREISTVRPLPKSTFRGLLIRLRYNLLSCSPPFRKLLLPGFRRFGRPPRRWISLRCQLGNLHRRDSHPLEWQLASLHDLPVPAQGAGVHGRFYDHAGSSDRSRYRSRSCCLPPVGQCRHPDRKAFRGSMAGPHVPLSTLRRLPRGTLRMTRGRCDSLHLHRGGLSPPAPCRSPGAPPLAFQ